VGKTSTARLLARALNCDHGPTIEPCGKCASCREILARGDSLDVHEIDGASNRKIEHARELIETIRYAPQRDRFRIAVIDEVHMLTTEAFNALLKTLEEPPPHARFILASTELHRIPPTIVSRCQRFNFRALTAAEISERLEKIAATEKIKITPGARALLASAAGGSLRDALSLLEQAATLSGGVIDEEGCARILALVDREQLEAICSAVASGDRAAAVVGLARLLETGEDPRHVLRELVQLLRKLLILAAGAAGELPEAERARLMPLAKAMPYENLLRALALAVEAESLSRRAEDSGLVLEMLVLRLVELKRLRTVEEALANVPSGPAARAESAPPPAPSRGETRGPRIVSLVAVEPEPEREPRSGGAAAKAQGVARFQEILEARRPITAAQASLAASVTLEGEELVLRFGIEKAAAKEALDEPGTRKLLVEAAREAFGRPLRVTLRTGPPADGDLGLAARDVPGEALSRERASSRAESDPVVRSALELFRAELTEVKEEE
jgi:DNA polymerase-3 subunit gamma/tau